MRSARFWAVVLVLIFAAAVRYRRGDVDLVPPSLPLNEFPQTMGSWSSVDSPIPQESLDLLGKGEFLSRVYTVAGTSAETADNAPVGQHSVGLFIAYFPTQRSGQSIHSPQNCLPGAGWTFASSGTADIAGADGQVHRVGDYVIANGAARDEVLYWYQSHGRAIASDYKAKLYMLTDAIRYNRTDAALVRIVVPIESSEGLAAAHERAVQFAKRTIPLLPAYVPN